MPRGFNSPLSHDSAAKLEIGTLESDMLPIGKFDIIRTAQPRFESVGRHGACELVIAPEII